MSYEVKYKTPRAWFWKTIKNVRGDLFFCDDRPGGSNQPLPVRVMVLEDNTRIELPMNNLILKFSPARFLDVIQRVEAETGQTLKIKK